MGGNFLHTGVSGQPPLGQVPAALQVTVEISKIQTYGDSRIKHKLFPVKVVIVVYYTPYFFMRKILI
jgi:hypothetical protein